MNFSFTISEVERGSYHNVEPQHTEMPNHKARFMYYQVSWNWLPVSWDDVSYYIM